MSEFIWRGAPLQVPEGLTVAAMIAGIAERQPERPALIDGVSGRTLSYRELILLAGRFAGGLGLRAGEGGSCVTILSPNSLEWAVAALGAMMAGGRFSGASPLSTPAEVVRHLRLTQSRFILTVPPLLDTASQAAREVGDVELIVAGPSAPGVLSFAEFQSPTPAVPHAPAPDATAMLPFSSGTTNLPKPVDLTHRALITVVHQIHGVFPFGPTERFLAVAPFFFIVGSAIILLGGLAAGATIIVAPRYELGAMLDLIEQHRITFTILTPPILTDLAERPEVEGRDFSSLHHIGVGGAPLRPDVEQAVVRRLGTTVVQAYGMTETGAPGAINPPDATRAGTCGKPFPLVEIRIVDHKTGADLGPGAMGEVWTRGPNLMRGYYGDPEATRATFAPDGWLRTGDLGYFDKDGYLHLYGRLNQLIPVDGHDVSPLELEELLAQHPAVADVAVVGRRLNAATAELPVAYIVPRGPFDPEEIVGWVAARVQPFKRIHGVRVVERVPRSPAGKILRRLLPRDEQQPARTAA